MRWFGFRKTWRAPSQLRLGVVLLALLAAAVLLGTFIPQAPKQTDSTAWWTAVSDRYGALYGPLRTLGLFDLYNTRWFHGLLALLLLNTLACLLNRVRPISKVVLKPRTRLPAERFVRAALRGQLTFASLEAAESAVCAALRRRRYRVQVEKQLGSQIPSQRRVHVRADRHRLPRLGTLLTHVGVVTLLLGAAYGGVRGWRAPALPVNSRTLTQVGHGTNASLRCDRFTIRRYDDGTARDYRADVTLLGENGEVRAQGTVRLNHPLTYGGVSYHLQGYRSANTTAAFHSVTEACDVTLLATFDPGYTLVIAAALCLLVGVTLTFHFPHRRLWARIAFTGKVTLVGSTSWDRERFEQQFAALLAELREEAALRGTAGGDEQGTKTTQTT